MREHLRPIGWDKYLTSGEQRRLTRQLTKQDGPYLKSRENKETKAFQNTGGGQWTWSTKKVRPEIGHLDLSVRK